MEFDSNYPNILLFMLPESSLSDKKTRLTPEEALKTKIVPEMFNQTGLVPIILDHKPFADKIMKIASKNARLGGMGIETIDKEDAHYKLVNMDFDGTVTEVPVYFRPLYLRGGCANVYPV